MNDIMKTIKSLEEFYLLIEGIRETIKNEAKKEKGEFLSMLLDTLGACLLGYLLTGKGAIAASQGKETIRACEIKMIKLKYKSIIKMNLNLMVFIQEIVYLKKRWGICNDEYKSIVTRLIALCVNGII